MRVAFLTAGGLAPCLSSAIAYLIQEYSKLDIEVDFFAYKNGYKGLLLGDIISIPNSIIDKVYYIPTDECLISKYWHECILYYKCKVCPLGKYNIAKLKYCNITL